MNVKAKWFTILIVLLQLSYSAYSLEELTFISEEYPPYNYTDQKGKFTGIAVDILGLMFQELNIKKTADDIQIFPWARGFALVQAPSQKNVLFTMARLPERDKLFKWVGPFSGLNAALFAKKEKSIVINTEEALKQYRYAIVRQDLSEALLRAAGLNNQHIIIVPNVESAIDRVLKGRADIFAHNITSLEKTLNKVDVSPEIFTQVYKLKGQQSYFAFNKNVSDETVKAYQAAFDKVTSEEGFFERLYSKHTK